MGLKAPHSKLEKLPPARDKVETLSVLRQTSRSASALAELKGIARTIPNQAMLINAIVLQEAKDSSEIENIITTQDELYKALTVNQTNLTGAIKEVVNYRKSVFFGADLVKRQGFLRVNDIVQIQQQLVDNTAGIRNMPGTVLKNDATGEIVYTPPQDRAEILDLMTDFINYFNHREDDLSPLIRLAILHCQFESIHPFYDGNGRSGRILNILFLLLNELIEVPILYLSSYIIAKKPEYYRLLNQVNHSGIWEGWILFMLKAIESTAKDTIAKIISIKNLLDQTLITVQTQLPKVYKKELVELLFEQPYSKIGFVVNRLNVERKAASRYLKEMESLGILEAKQVGRETLYINKGLIEMLKQ